MEMEMDSESWLHYRPINEQFPNATSLKLPLDDNGMQNMYSPCVATSTNGTASTFGLSDLTNIKPVGPKEPHGWFHGWPCSRQGLTTNLPDKVLGNENCVKITTPTTGNGLASTKQFLVFDQAGNKTTMMFSSGIGTSIPRPTAWNSQPTCFRNFNDVYSGPNLTDDDDNGSVVGSDMREDSEEINALLYSDEEDDYSDDGEEASTGHSPSSMTAYEKHDWVEEEDMDEVASSAGPVKRQKLSEGNYQVTATVKPKRSLEYEDDAESSCVGCPPIPYTDMVSSTGTKRIRREKIRETVSILQTILPCGKGMDAVTVLDEAINYLKTLKAKSLSHSKGSEEL